MSVFVSAGQASRNRGEGPHPLVLDQAITAYRANPTEQNKAMVEKAFAELDVEIAELKQKAATDSREARIETERKLADLQAYRERQRANYSAERAEAAAESAEDAMEDAAKDVGRAIEKSRGSDSGGRRLVRQGVGSAHCAPVRNTEPGSKLCRRLNPQSQELSFRAVEKELDNLNRFAVVVLRWPAPAREPREF